MKNKGLSFILAALSIASAFASGTVTAPNGNVGIDTGSPSFNYTIFLSANVTFDQSLSSTDSPSFAAISTTGRAQFGAHVSSPNIGENLNVYGYSVLAYATPYANFYDTSGSTNNKWGRLGFSNGVFTLEALNDAYTNYSVLLKLDSTGLNGVDLGQFAPGKVATTELKVGSSPVAITNIRMGRATLMFGGVTVLDSTVTSSTLIFICQENAAGYGILGADSKIPGVSFHIGSTSMSTQTVVYLMIEP